MNTITIELCAEDRARLDSLLAKLDRCIGEFIPSGDGHTDYGYKAQGVEYATQDEAAEAKLEEIPEPYSEPCPFEVPAVTRADVQQKVVSLSAAGKKEKVRAVVNAYAPKVSGIPEDKLAEVLEKLNALEG